MIRNFYRPALPPSTPRTWPALVRAGLDSLEASIVLWLFEHVPPEEWFVVNRSEIVSDLDVRDETVRRRMNDLEKREIIERGETVQDRGRLLRFHPSRIPSAQRIEVVERHDHGTCSRSLIREAKTTRRPFGDRSR